jgi:dipeptidase D
MLLELQKDVPFQMVSFEAGTRRNVISSEGGFVIAVDPRLVRDFTVKIAFLRETLRIKAADVEKKEIVIEYSQVFQSESFMMTGEATAKLLRLLSKLPHGVRRWNEKIAGLPLTSTNLATVTTETETVRISMMTRSSIGAELSELRTEIKNISEEYGASVEHPDDYPGWNLDFSSLLLAIVKTEYMGLVGQEPKISATHCGLECGAIAGNPFFGNLDAISIGPTILEPHSTRERVNIDSVAATYRLVKNILEKIIR